MTLLLLAVTWGRWLDHVIDTRGFGQRRDLSEHVLCTAKFTVPFVFVVFVALVGECAVKKKLGKERKRQSDSEERGEERRERRRT